MRSGRELGQLDARQFIAEVDTLTEIYAAAMDVPAGHLPGRRALMERHAGYSEFRAVVARLTAADGGEPRGQASGRAIPNRRRRSPIVGFAYGFHGARGQWWHDMVWDALERTRGHAFAQRWLDDSFEVAEVHVRPDEQCQGIGRAMMTMLAAHRPERTAVLSTPEGETIARHLYESLGFTDLVPGFRFPGADEPYAIMGAGLPLREAAGPRPRSARPSR